VEACGKGNRINMIKNEEEKDGERVEARKRKKKRKTERNKKRIK
jgi:hypothetical protein